MPNALEVTRPADVEPSTGALMQMAIERGPEGVEMLERLVQLKVQQEERAARQAFIKALGRFRAKCPAIVKRGVGRMSLRSGGEIPYKFAKLDDLCATVDPLLAEEDLSYRWDFDVINGREYVVFILSHVDGHCESSRFPAPPFDTGSKITDIQKMGGAQTYAMRRSMIAGLGLSAVEQDNDGGQDELSEEQVADVSSLMDEVYPLPSKAEKRKQFLRWAGAESVTQIKRDRFAEVVQFLERKRGAE